MKTFLTLSLFCCLALLHKAAAQSTAADSANNTHPAQAAPRSSRMQAMRDRRPGFFPPSAPFAGEPARNARRDARQFKLPKDLIPKVRDGEISSTSDYFKPTAASTSSPALLADSAYVKDYRFFAYNNGSRQLVHPVGTGLLIGGGIVVVVTAVTIVVVNALSHVKFE